MSLSDVVSSLDLGMWAIAALLIFLGVFVAITWRVVRSYPRSRACDAARLVFEDGRVSGQGGAA